MSIRDEMIKFKILYPCYVLMRTEEIVFVSSYVYHKSGDLFSVYMKKPSIMSNDEILSIFDSRIIETINMNIDIDIDINNNDSIEEIPSYDLSNDDR